MATQQPRPPGELRFQLSRSTVFPLVGGRSTWSKGHLLPLFATILVGVALFAIPAPWIRFSTDAEINQAWQVFWILALYIAFLVNYYVYEICGRAEHWWLIAGVALFTWRLLATPFWYYWYMLFYNVLPAAQWQKSPDVAVNLAGYLFGTGLCEEGFKALPLLGLALLGAGLAFLGRHAKGKLGSRLTGIATSVGLSEPLDGILFGVASGSGFFISETLGQYVPGAMSQAKYAGSQAFEGLVLLLARGLPDLAEHSAWSGLFGYFIGLAALRPGMAIFLLPLGWLSAAALHAGWDGIDAVTNSGLIVVGFQAFVGMLSYALLAGAILKAREISPTRASNFATIVTPEGMGLPVAPGSAVPLSRSGPSEGL